MGTLEDNKLVELVASPEHVAEYVMIINNQTPIEIEFGWDLWLK